MAKVRATGKKTSMRGVNANTMRGGRNVLSGRTAKQGAARYGAGLRGGLSRAEAESAAYSTGAGGGGG
jgi:hypothetical protein